MEKQSGQAGGAGRRRVALWAASAAVWLLGLGWLTLWEAYPEWRTDAAAGYATLLGDDLLVADQWMLIRFGDDPIGYTHTSVNVDEAGTAQATIVDSHTVLLLNILGTPRRVRVRARAELDAGQALRRFSFTLSSHDYTLDLDGERAAPDAFDVTLRTGAVRERMRVAVPEDAVLYSPMADLAMRRLEPGQSMRIQAFNPVSLTTEPVMVRALRREPLVWRGAPREAVVLSAEVQGMEVLSWVDADGRLLRQTTPLGWTMEACDAAEALAVRSAPGAGDLLEALAVPVAGVVDDPHVRARLTLRLSGLPGTHVLPHGPRQRIARVDAAGAIVDLRRETVPPPAPRGVFPDALAADLAATPFVQSGAPEIRARAEALTDGETNAVAAALAIYNWVHDTLRKEPAVSLPSALDVLRVRAGDCNEHTVLFTALARAAGLPARITVGLVYQDGAFYYHAWPAVYAGRWWELDPTLGLPAVGASHVRLLQGELPEQMALMGLLGRLRAEVMEEQPR
jgi:hypothetical protein